MKKLLSIIVLNFSVLLCNDPNARSVETMTKPGKQEEGSVPLHNYFLANYDQFGGKFQQAERRYKDIFDSSAPLYTYKGYIHLLYDTGNFAQILQIIPQLDSFFTKDSDIG